MLAYLTTIQLYNQCCISKDAFLSHCFTKIFCYQKSNLYLVKATAPQQPASPVMSSQLTSLSDHVSKGINIGNTNAALVNSLFET